MKIGRLITSAGLMAVGILSQYRTYPQVAPPRISPPQTYVLTDKVAYMPLPPELIAAPVVRAITYSPDGRYALIQRENMHLTQATVTNALATKQALTGELSLILWNSEDRSTSIVWRGPAPEASVEQVEWLHGSDSALVLVRQPEPTAPAKSGAARPGHQILLRVSGSTAKSVEIGATQTGRIGALSISASPLLPIAIVQELRPTAIGGGAAPLPDQASVARQSNETAMFIVDNLAGNSIRITVPTDDESPTAQWDTNGNPLITVFHRGPGDAKPAQRWLTVNVRNGAVTPITPAPSLYARNTAPSPPGDIQVRAATVDVRQGEIAEKVGLLWLESAVKSEFPRSLISGDCTEGRLLQGCDVVVYKSQQAYWAVPLVKVNRDMALNAIEMARRAVMSRAKVVGLALLMCANDNDDNLPAQGALNSILPYLRNGDTGIMDGFNYSFAGGSLTDIENLADTILGTMDGPGGHAILYADGHVKWQ